MKGNEIFGGSCLKAADLGGKRRKLTIKDCQVVDFGDGNKKPVLTFEGTDRELAVNKTNWNRIVEVTGQDDSDNWRGKSIEIYPDRVDFKGDMVDAIRVHLPKEAPPPAEDDGDLPF